MKRGTLKRKECRLPSRALSTKQGKEWRRWRLGVPAILNRRPPFLASSLSSQSSTIRRIPFLTKLLASPEALVAISELHFVASTICEFYSLPTSTFCRKPQPWSSSASARHPPKPRQLLHQRRAPILSRKHSMQQRTQ